MDWLTEGKKRPTSEPLIAEGVPPYGNKIRIPIVSHASADPFGGIDWEPLDYEYAEIERESICLEVDNDSMLPIARSGQRVICSRDRSVTDSDLAAVKMKDGEGPLFKRVYHYKDEGAWLLESINQGNPKPPRLVPNEEIEYIYKVVGILFE